MVGKSSNRHSPSSIIDLVCPLLSAELPAGKYDVVVTDCACPPPLQKSATSQEVPLVSAEWLIQSVIRGERQGFGSEPQYRHDYAS